MPETTNNISLRYFRDVAQLNGEGVVRFSSDPDQRLVNKGQLHSRIATFFDNIGRFFTKKDTRDERNLAALEGFRASLVANYGDFGKEALKKAELGQGQDRALTGRDILHVMDRAETLRRAAINEEARRHSDKTLYPGVIDELTTTLAERDADPGTIETCLDEFHKRVSDRCRFESDLFGRVLSNREIIQFSAEEKDIVLKQHDDEDEGFSCAQWRTQMRSTATKLLEKVQDKDELTGHLDEIERTLRNLNDSGDISVKDDGRIRQYAKALFARQISTQIERDGTIDQARLDELVRAQHAMLRKDSLWRQVYREEVSDTRKAIMDGMADAMARVLGSVTNRPEGDREWLDRPLNGGAPRPELGAPNGDEANDIIIGDDPIIIDDGLGPIYHELENDGELVAAGLGKVLSDGGLKTEFEYRFEQRCLRESNLGARQLPPERVASIARDEMKRFLGELDEPEEPKDGKARERRIQEILSDRIKPGFFDQDEMNRRLAELDDSKAPRSRTELREEREKKVQEFFDGALKPGFTPRSLDLRLTALVNDQEFVSRGPAGEDSGAAAWFLTKLRTMPREDLIALRDQMLKREIEHKVVQGREQITDKSSAVQQMYRQAIRTLAGSDDPRARGIQRVIEDLVRAMCIALDEPPYESLSKLR